ncbi:PspC domain-containing protein [Streptomyces sp. NBC_00820]|uniref:PspC domain-containing protein n=1 Tax=Streptomyces sp. NBC_00820 TaxID=2975842 RepID=UPI002ED3BB90|nr:PspC domain-containing protein [Streptomyces sp. NBC_00820]
MTDHEHAATGPGPGSGPRPDPGTGPTDAAPAATGRPGQTGGDGTGPTGAGASPGTDRGAGTGARTSAGTSAGTDTRAGADTEERDPAQDPAATAQGFRRDRRHKVIAGVCSGLGRQTDMDPVIYRITLAVLAATGGIGLIFYGFAWLLVPYEDEEENEVRKLLTGRVDGQALAGVLFALVGCGVVLTTLRNGAVLTFAVVLSLLLAGAGYWSRHRDTPDPSPSSGPHPTRGHPIAAQAAADAPPEAQAPPVTATYPSWWRDPIGKDGTQAGGTGYLWGPGDARGRDVASAVNVGIATPWTHPGSLRTPKTDAPRPRGPRWIGGWIFLLALLAGGLGAGLTWDTRPAAISLQTGLACALVVLGLGIALSAFLGRTGAGSVFLALITAALLAGASALPEDVTAQWKKTSWKPANAADARSGYDLGTGVGTLDLRRLHPAKGQTLTTRAEVGAGRLKVIVPADATARISIDVGLGDVRLPGENRKDVDVEPGRHEDLTLPPAKGGKNAGTWEIELQVGVGQVEVSRAAS